LCILLMDVAGYTARETAQILDCPRGTVLARVHRARRRLALLLTGRRGEDAVDGTDRGVGEGRIVDRHEHMLMAFLAGAVLGGVPALARRRRTST
jgi:hypothetical protein